jgi:hypothetical protein
MFEYTNMELNKQQNDTIKVMCDILSEAVWKVCRKIFAKRFSIFYSFHPKTDSEYLYFMN